LKCIQTSAAARDCSGAHRSAPAIPCFGTGHAPPTREPRLGRCRPRRAAQPSRWPHAPTPCHHVAPPVARPPLPAASPLKGPITVEPHFFPLLSSFDSTRLSTPLPPPLFPRPRVRAGRSDCRRCAVFAPLCHRFSPSVSTVVPPSSTPFGPRLTSLVPSSSCRTRRRPPQPPELRHRLGMPPRRAVFSAPPSPAVSDENPAAPTMPSATVVAPPWSPRRVRYT
jgi:hypothetical protein